MINTFTIWYKRKILKLILNIHIFFYVYSTPSILAIFMNKWCHYSIILKYKSNALLFNVFVQWIRTYLKFLKPIIYYIFSTVLKNDEHLKRNKRSQTDGNIFLRTRHRSNTITSVFLSEDTGNEFPNIEYFSYFSYPYKFI